jgi:hypothetical protein
MPGLRIAGNSRGRNPAGGAYALERSIGWDELLAEAPPVAGQ